MEDLGAILAPTCRRLGPFGRDFGRSAPGQNSPKSAKTVFDRFSVSRSPPRAPRPPPDLDFSSFRAHFFNNFRKFSNYIYIDSAAQQTRFDFAQNYDISTINAKKSVLDGIAHVAAIVDNDKLLVDQRSDQVLSCLDQYQWDSNPNLAREKPKHNMASHMADALRYALYSFETSQTGF